MSQPVIAPIIALVDDDRNILTSVTMALEAEGFTVQTYNDGAAALEGFARAMPQLAVLDIKMPRMDGLELLTRLRERSALPVIFLTSKDDEVDELQGLRLGADDYIKKPFSQKLLVARIHALLRRGQAEAVQQNDDRIYAYGPVRLDDSRHQCRWDGTVLDLTVTEYLLLKALATRPGHVRTREQLIGLAYGDNIHVDDRTIDSHIKRIRKKFKAIDDTFDSIETLYGIGYRYREH